MKFSLKADTNTDLFYLFELQSKYKCKQCSKCCWLVTVPDGHKTLLNWPFNIKDRFYWCAHCLFMKERHTINIHPNNAGWIKYIKSNNHSLLNLEIFEFGTNEEKILFMSKILGNNN